MANTNNWLNPATGAVDPTHAQTLGLSTVVCDATIDGTGITMTITHNLNISAADLALGWPTTVIVPQTLHSSDGTGAARVTSWTADTLVITFITAVAQLLRLYISRPHTLTR